MISYFRYWDAKRRLASAQKTIEMMGDSSNYMLEAQKDMLDREVEEDILKHKSISKFKINFNSETRGY